MERFNSGKVFGDTNRIDNYIKTLYPQAKFTPVCALGCYYNVYSDDSYSVLIAEYNYLDKSDSIPNDARAEFRPFGSFFKVKFTSNFAQKS